MSSSFDWRAFVNRTKPGLESQEAQERLVNLEKITAELTEWASRMQLPPKRVQVSAYTGIYSTPTPIPYQQALLAAKYTLWLFALDGYIDKLDYSQFTPTEAERKQIYLDKHLQPIVKPLYGIGDIAGLAELPLAIQLPATLLDAALPENTFSDDVALSDALGRALYDIYQELSEIAGSANQEFLLKTFKFETAAVLGAMRNELRQSFRFQQSFALAELPGLEEYLENSLFSICLRAAGTIALFFEANPRLVWEQWLAAMTPGAKALRLSNDIANVLSELEEQKVNSVTIALAQLGYNPMGAYQEANPAIVEARRLLRNRLESELAGFALLSTGLVNGPLAYYIYSSVAYTIAMYEAGDYAIPL